MTWTPQYARNLKTKEYDIPYNAIFDGNIDRQHLRPPVLAILLETIERENLMDH